MKNSTRLNSIVRRLAPKQWMTSNDVPLGYILPAEREQQFLRLRDRIEERAARKFMGAEFEGNPPGIVLRKIDFR